MTWVRLDDRFPSHRKIALLSDRAFRLHVSALCWCAENLTDGVIHDNELRLVAHVRGMTATARELVTGQCWERIESGYRIHDYLDYNPTRAQVLAEREKNAARQQAFRERKADREKPSRKGTQPPKKIGSNGVTPPVTNSVSNGCPAPDPHPEVTPNGVTSATTTRAAQPDPSPSRSYDTLADLKKAISEAGISGVSWNLQASQIERARQVVERIGIAPMTAMAANSASFRGTPASASAWLTDWESLEPETPGKPQLRAVSGGYQPYRNPTDQSVYDEDF